MSLRNLLQNETRNEIVRRLCKTCLSRLGGAILETSVVTVLDLLGVLSSNAHVDERINANAERIERLAKDMKNQNDELNRQISHLKQCLTHIPLRSTMRKRRRCQSLTFHGEHQENPYAHTPRTL